MDDALMATSKGKRPLVSLRENVVWTDDENDTTCALEYWLGDECVYRKCNVYVKKGSQVLGKIGVI